MEPMSYSRRSTVICRVGVGAVGMQWGQLSWMGGEELAGEAWRDALLGTQARRAVQLAGCLAGTRRRPAAQCPQALGRTPTPPPGPAPRTCVWLRCLDGSDTPPGPTSTAAAAVSAMGPCCFRSMRTRRRDSTHSEWLLPLPLPISSPWGEGERRGGGWQLGSGAGEATGGRGASGSAGRGCTQLRRTAVHAHPPSAGGCTAACLKRSRQAGSACTAV